MSELTIVTTSDRHDLDDEARAAFRQNWPEFIFHDPVVARYIGRVETYFPDFDIMLLDDGAVVAGGWGVPLSWDGTVAALPAGGYDGALAAAVSEYEERVQPDTLCIMAATVRRDRQGGGLAGRTLTALRERATSAGLQRVIAPVRPSLKTRYPLTPMDSFARWHRSDGLHLDPWIRTHQRLGATILGTAPNSMIIKGTVADWANWTEMAFPETGGYVVPEALDLVEIDREGDIGTYTETNLWMRHL
jgi:GNAT superfamily N-acetyltransferase